MTEKLGDWDGWMDGWMDGGREGGRDSFDKSSQDLEAPFKTLRESKATFSVISCKTLMRAVFA